MLLLEEIVLQRTLLPPRELFCLPPRVSAGRHKSSVPIPLLLLPSGWAYDRIDPLPNGTLDEYKNDPSLRENPHIHDKVNQRIDSAIANPHEVQGAIDHFAVRKQPLNFGFDGIILVFPFAHL